MAEIDNEVVIDPESLLDTLGSGQPILKYKKGQTLFSQGDPADAVFYLREGKIKVVMASEQGKEAVVSTQVSGAFLGERCLIGQQQRFSSAIAMTDCEIVRIERDTMIRALHDNPAFSQTFIAHLLNRTIRIEEDLVDLMFNSSEKRLARTLLLLANFGNEGQTEAVIPKVSQETLAEMIGTTRSRVNFFMNKFRKLGFIDYNDDLKIRASLMSVVLQEPQRIKSNDE